MSNSEDKFIDEIKPLIMDCITTDHLLENNHWIEDDNNESIFKLIQAVRQQDGDKWVSVKKDIQRILVLAIKYCPTSRGDDWSEIKSIADRLDIFLSPPMNESEVDNGEH